jgi:hypothetical protein
MEKAHQFIKFSEISSRSPLIFPQDYLGYGTCHIYFIVSRIVACAHSNSYWRDSFKFLIIRHFFGGMGGTPVPVHVLVVFAPHDTPFQNKPSYKGIVSRG